MTTEPLGEHERSEFVTLVWDYYKTNGRNQLPWRIPGNNGEIDPYHVLVSELMLQQTQVSRVMPKFLQFIKTFPTVQSLSNAELSDVLVLWSGLGYNRRAKFLHASARRIMNTYNGKVPRSLSELVTLPGVGQNTASAIVAYSFNEPVVYIETNIRTVYIHHFFPEHTEVTDAQIIKLVECTVDTSDPRQWYWALMDYGSYLKSSLPNPSRRSKHHSVQSTFAGSRREIRGQVLRLLIERPQTLPELKSVLADKRLDSILGDLLGEGLINCSDSTYTLGK